MRRPWLPQLSRPAARAATRTLLLSVLLLAVVLATACGSSSPPASGIRNKSRTTAVPLATSLANARGTWAILAMGRLNQPLNTFWQAFYLPAGAHRWELRTPPGAADNGGLVAATEGTRALIGVRASQLLHFSPLASTSNGSKSYKPGLIRAALADVPDALSLGTSGQAAALAGKVVLSRRAGSTAWQRIASAKTLAGSRLGRACGVRGLTAVLAKGPGTLVGASCSRPGVAGLFSASAAGTAPAGLKLQAGERASRATVLRLAHAGNRVAALVELRSASATAYIAGWSQAGSHAWTLSPPLSTTGTLVSTAITYPPGLAVVTAGSRRRIEVSSIRMGASTWRHLPSPPEGTTTVAIRGKTVDALVAHNSTFSSLRLVERHWVRGQTIHVPVTYGSSG